MAPLLQSNITLKSRVASGETLYGLFLMSASPTIAEIAGLAAYDFVVVDMEHGVDGIQIGPRDLGASMGYLKDPGNPKARKVLLAAEKRVVALQKAGKGPFLGGISTQQHKPEELRERGYNIIAGGVDVGLFRQAAVEDVQSFRRGAATPANKNHKISNVGHVPSAA